MYVFEARTAEPQGAYDFKGRIAATADEWAIDGLALPHDGTLYFICSGWRLGGDGFPQLTYIAPMKNLDAGRRAT
jgi:hypothetical protein